MRLPADYLADGHVDHGYAMTIHKAQGMTTGRSFVLASPDLARELGYVAASRHTDEARFYVNVPDPDERPPGEPALEDRDLYSMFERRLGTERAKHLALDETEIDTRLGDLSTAQLLEIQDRGRTLLTSIPNQARRARDAALIAHAASNLAHIQELRDKAQAELDQLSERRRDRHQRALLEDRLAQLEGAIDSNRQELADRTDQAADFDFNQWLADNELEVVEAAAADRELAVRRADAYWRATRTVSLDVDPEIERRLGERPDSPSDREEWERAAAAQESYALQYGQLPDPDIHDTASLTGRQFDDFKQALDLAEKFVDPPTPDLDLGPDLGP